MAGGFYCRLRIKTGMSVEKIVLSTSACMTKRKQKCSGTVKTNGFISVLAFVDMWNIIVRTQAYVHQVYDRSMGSK